MLPFHVYVKYVDRIVYMDLIEPGDCSVISLINDTRKILSGCQIERWDTWQLRITFLWNGQQHVLTTDEELLLCFQLFESRNMSTIEFELILVPNAIHFHEVEPAGLLGFNEQNIGNPVEENKNELVEEDNVEPDEENEEGEAEPIGENNEENNAKPVEETNEEDNDYKVDDESVVDSDMSLDDENDENEYVNNDHCEADGNEAAVVVSSDEETALTRVGRYCQSHQWTPNPNGTISLEDGQVIGNAKFTREVIKKYAIQEGFALKKIKNDRHRYTMTCKNDACDWRLHASCLTDKITFMIKSVRGSHSMCLRVAENKEATSRSVASVLGNFNRSNPTGKAKLFKIELQDRFAVKVDSQTIYRAKRIVLETLKIHHAEAYAKLKKYGNSIRTMNLGTDMKVAMNPEVQSDNPTFMRFYLSFNACKSEPVEKWARHAFEPSIKADHISNNMCECFNSWIREDRDKPVLQLLEILRRKLMVWFYEKWAEVEKLNDSITPYAMEHLTTTEKEARKL
ncbi:hypothetical protein LWI28_013725 [Acer negundo]|uniref:Transposase MuDR plant domain-containing protein n=1 Tax=Acer negundo TaxID=4023 RepID=A0AAD5JAG4_ACENE|nr:hypothetical protein LWI28_013725 [Acer negundo]